MATTNKFWLKETSAEALVSKYKKLVDQGAPQSDMMEVLVELDSRGVDIFEMVRSYEGQYPYKLMEDLFDE